MPFMNNIYLLPDLFEPSGMLFMLVALLFTVVGSFTVGYTLQKLHIAQYMFGKSRIIK